MLGQKSCSNCHGWVPDTTQVGDFCPHCGVQFRSESRSDAGSSSKPQRPWRDVWTDFRSLPLRYPLLWLLCYATWLSAVIVGPMLGVEIVLPSENAVQHVLGLAMAPFLSVLFALSSFPFSIASVPLRGVYVLLFRGATRARFPKDSLELRDGDKAVFFWPESSVLFLVLALWSWGRIAMAEIS